MRFPKISPRKEGWFSAALVVLVTLLTYAPLILSLGFYRDDWYLIWTAQARGAAGIRSLFEGDRPFVGWLYALDYSLLGNSPLPWHLYALLIKALSALALLWLLRSLWQDRKIETALIALLFVVYPGFYQQPNAATFKNLLLAHGAAMASLALTIQALKAGTSAGKAALTAMSLLLGLFYIFIYEALIGIEAVRLLLIWYQSNRSGTVNWKTTIRRVLLQSTPYLLFAAGFVFWRLFLFQSTRRATNLDVVLNEFGPLSLDSLTRLMVEMVKDLFETSFLAWGVPYYQFSANGNDYRITALAAAAALVVILLIGLYIFIVKSQGAAESDAGQSPNAERDWIVLGAVIIIVTTLPVVLAGRNVIFGIQWDRYTYQSIVGAVLLMGGFVFYAVKGRLRWALLAFLLISGIMTQLFSANYYRRFWRVERDAMWQMAWRAPQIKEGTTLVLVLPGEYALAEEYEVWGPINLVYYPNEELKLSGQVLYDGLWLEADLGAQEERLVRGTVLVKRDYNKLLLVTQPSVFSCLHVVDGRRVELAAMERLDVQRLAIYSDVSLINPPAPRQSLPARFSGASQRTIGAITIKKLILPDSKTIGGARRNWRTKPLRWAMNPTMYLNGCPPSKHTFISVTGQWSNVFHC